ncbi:MAG: helix-turn-helix domain-containing protein [Chloroflexota bacterium]
MLHPIQRYRIAKGWTQSELARQVGVSVNTVQAWERGAGIRPRNLTRLAGALGIEPLRLVNEIEEWREASSRGRR